MLQSPTAELVLSTEPNDDILHGYDDGTLGMESHEPLAGDGNQMQLVEEPASQVVLTKKQKEDILQAVEEVELGIADLGLPPDDWNNLSVAERYQVDEELARLNGSPTVPTFGQDSTNAQPPGGGWAGSITEAGNETVPLLDNLGAGIDEHGAPPGNSQYLYDY